MNALLLSPSSSFRESVTLVFQDKCTELCFGKEIKVTLIFWHSCSESYNAENKILTLK